MLSLRSDLGLAQTEQVTASFCVARHGAAGAFHRTQGLGQSRST